MKTVTVLSIYLLPEKGRVIDQEIMTVEQVADYLQISKKSVYQLVHEGKLPACKFLDKWHFNRHSVSSGLDQINPRQLLAHGIVNGRLLCQIK